MFRSGSGPGWGCSEVDFGYTCYGACVPGDDPARKKEKKIVLSTVASRSPWEKNLSIKISCFWS